VQPLQRGLFVWRWCRRAIDLSVSTHPVRGLLSLHSTPLRPLAISAALKQSGLDNDFDILLRRTHRQKGQWGLTPIKRSKLAAGDTSTGRRNV
jgi:hypothetical protein